MIGRQVMVSRAEFALIALETLPVFGDHLQFVKHVAAKPFVVTILMGIAEVIRQIMRDDAQFPRPGIGGGTV